MNKLDLETKNIIDDNIDKIGSIFPNVIVESENGQSIDFDLLKQELSSILIDGNKEKYQLTWPGKKDAIVNANTPTTKTLRPIKEKSVNFDNTENIYIEGDNLEVLKILQESYLNKIKCIYIDPPYNTGNDFIYNDKFSRTKEEELEESGQIDEDGNRMISNSQSNGKYHSDWLSMMYPRLKLARNLLTDDGVIFISIDDNEHCNLKKICDEIFGENNFVANIIWQKKFSPQNDSLYFSNMHDFIVCIAKKRKNSKQDTGWNRILLERNEMPSNYNNPDNDPRGFWSSGDFTAEGPTENCIYEITSPKGHKHLPPKGKRWVYNKENFEKLYKENRFWFGKNGDAYPRIKRYWNEVQQGMVPNTIWFYGDAGHNQEGKQEVNKLMQAPVFDFPKPVKLITRLLKLIENDKMIILDFFSGSSTTAHACMQLNSEDNGNRKYIMVQLQEECDSKSEAFKNGYKNICDIGQERIKRAGNKIKEETNKDIDYGFRVYKVDSSNMTDVYHQPNDLKQTELRLFEENIKEDRNSEDLLTQVILDLGLTLDLKIGNKNINNNNVYFVADNSLIACFDNNISINMIDEIVKYNPLKVVFRDSSFGSDNDRINIEEKFKKYSPETEVSII